MPTYNYTAKTKTGERKQGTVEASDRLDAVRRVESLGLVPIVVQDNSVAPPAQSTEPGTLRWMARHVRLIIFSVLFVVVALGVGIALGLPTYWRAKLAFGEHRYAECISILESGPRLLKQSDKGLLLKANAVAAILNSSYSSGQYDRCLEIIESLYRGRYDLAPKEVLEMRDSSKAAMAQRRFKRRDFDGALVLLKQIPSTFSKYSDIQAMRRKAQLNVEVERQLPVQRLVEDKSVIISNRSRINISSGIVDYVDLSKMKLYLRNPTHDRVKPDLKVLILNQDGVILLSHAENWLFKTLDYDQSHVADITEPLRFPPSLVFSRWALLAWDVVPHYALAVGSKTSYDAIRSTLIDESRRLRETTPERLTTDYSLSDLLPEAKRFSYGSTISTPESDIVSYVSFTQGNATLWYKNATDMRIKPKVKGYVFNADGVIIGSFGDVWLLDSLDPGEERSVTKSLTFDIPDELVFSRWAPVAYDMEPTHFVLAGSSEQFEEMSRYAESRISDLNRKSWQ